MQKPHLWSCTSWWWRSCFSFMNSLILIHLPLGFSSIGSSSIVENHGSLHADDPVSRRENIARRASGLPVPRSREPVGSPSPGFSLLPRNEEKPLLGVSATPLSWKLWKKNNLTKIKRGLISITIIFEPCNIDFLTRGLLKWWEMK